MSTIFEKIVKGEIPADIVYQDELVTAFKDINPIAPVHLLIVPNHVIPTINDITEADEPALGRMLYVAKKLAAENGIADNGFRLMINCNEWGGQTVFHLHLHILGGRPLGEMLPPDPATTHT